MGNALPNIEYSKSKKNPSIDSDTSMYLIPFYKDSEYFSNLDNFVSFVKATEMLVRTSKFYKRYIKYIKEDIGLNFCQVLSNIKQDEESDMVEIEMHHGPILTLFDYVSIIVDFRLAHDKKINSFLVADIVLDEHFKNNIQIVMLSKTAHEEVHNGNIFLNFQHAFGDFNAFIEKYRDGLSYEQIAKINKYIEQSKKYDSFDKGVFQLSEQMRSLGTD